MFELAKDPEFLSRIRAEATASMPQPNGPKSALDDGHLFPQPLMHSSYAEVLRLHTYNLLVTMVTHDDFTFREWNFPKDQLVALSTYTAHMDSRVWNTRSGNTERPLKKFWAKRFLIHKFDSRSGPLNSGYSASLRRKNPSE